MKKISIIIPCYNEEEALPIYYDAMKIIMNDLKEVQFELIFVDDGSKDNTLNEMRKLAKKDKCVRFISFSRNFGKESAMYAGLENSTGDYVAIMDVDLQDPPELIKQMYEILEKGEYDCVGSRRVTRSGEPKLRSYFSKKYYKLINKISETEIKDGSRDFRLMTRQMVNSILELNEYNRYSKGLFSWVGYKTKWLEYENKPRSAGQTKWNFVKLFKYAIESIVDFSSAPLKISSFIGLLFCFISFIMIIVIIIRKLIMGDPVAGWPSLVCIIFFVSGIQLFCLGIIGEYIANMYTEVKKRPIYIVKETEKENK
jgi:glucosyltransferase